MPDKWEYPWYAAWDLAFHCLPIALVDSDFAKEQLHPHAPRMVHASQRPDPAYEWAFGDVNPPVHAWAALRVTRSRRNGAGWAIGRFSKGLSQADAELHMVGEPQRRGGPQRISRRIPRPGQYRNLRSQRAAAAGGHLEQSDGTRWMAMYCCTCWPSRSSSHANLHLRRRGEQFWEHFVYIANALNTLGLWSDEDGFYYDVLHLPDGSAMPLKVRSMVGLVPLFAVETLDAELLERLPCFDGVSDGFSNTGPTSSQAVPT